MSEDYNENILMTVTEERPRPVERLSLALREPDYNFVPVVFIVCVVGATMLVESELGLLYTVVSRIKGLIVHSGAPDCTRGHNSLRTKIYLMDHHNPSVYHSVVAEQLDRGDSQRPSLSTEDVNDSY
uniref:Transmembrane protein n=1 Tax=Heterorhabditis bacteriophora TaxID=37862 RepID=A0A1I7X8K5_HETBA